MIHILQCHNSFANAQKINIFVGQMCKHLNFQLIANTKWYDQWIFQVRNVDFPI